MKYAEYEYLQFESSAQGILTVTISRPDRMNAMNERLHWEVSRLFHDLEGEKESIVVITGSGTNFSSGGDLEMVRRMPFDRELIRRQHQECLDMVYGLINSSKIVIAAIEGHAVGAGLAVALLSDISVASATARLSDGHSRVGVAAGDHAALIWPLLCGMARAKHLILTGKFISGQDAADIGLVSMAVEEGKALEEASGIAVSLTQVPSQTLSWTKRALNGWLRAASPIFEQSLALEMLSFGLPEVPAQLEKLTKGRRQSSSD